MSVARRVARAFWLGVLLAPFSLAVPFPHPYLVALIPTSLAIAEWIAQPQARRAAFVLFPLALLAAAEWSVRHVPATGFGQTAIIVSAILGYLAFRSAEGRERLFWLLFLGGAIVGLHARMAGSDPVWLAAYVGAGVVVFLVDEIAPAGIAWVSQGARLGAAALGAAAFVAGGAVLVAGIGAPSSGGPGVLSRSPSGGTPATPIPVGTPISPSTNALIRIDGAPSSAYWQEAVYSSYANGVWSTSPGRTETVASGAASLPAMDGQSEPASTTTWHVHVTYLTGASVPVIYAGRPLALSVVQGPAVIRVATGAAEILAPGTRSYDLTLAMPTLDVQALATAPFPTAASGAGLAVPGSIRPEITRLARTVTKGANSPWQAAQDIAAYLDSHERYSTSFAAQPSASAISNFLFRTHVGDCDQFSTAFVLMMRSLGVPANWVVGFAPGVYNPTTKTETLRAMDEHSWAEVDFGSAGWAPIDPTPGFAFLTLPATRPVEAKRPAPSPASPPALTWPETAGAAVLALALVAFYVLRLQRRPADAELWALLTQVAERRGKNLRGLTPRAVARLCTAGERGEVLPAVDLLEAIWYGGRAADPVLVKDAARRVRAVLQGVPSS